MEYTPQIVRRLAVCAGELELVEWRWPDMLEFRDTQSCLMLELSLPPYSTDASAEFPGIAPGNRCFMGTMFIRYPGVELWGRGEGVRSRVIRVIFSEDRARMILGRDPPVPDLDMLQSLLDIRHEGLRDMLRLAHREITRLEEPSAEAVEAYMSLIAVELRRLFGRVRRENPPGRLAPWQHKKIRERLDESAARPTTEELAALCGISPRHLHRQFTQLTGKTIGRYVEDYWVERGKAMLEEPSTPIKAVAVACGFPHATSFTRAFKRSVGMLPSAYRQQAGKSGLPQG